MFRQRPRVFRQLCLASLVVAGALPLVAPASGSKSTSYIDVPKVQVSWPKYHYDLTNTGFNPFETQLGVENVSTLSLSWQYRTYSAWGTPALWNGTIYVTGTTHHLPIATVISALDASTGSLIWTRRILGTANIRGVMYYQGGLYLGTDDYQFRCFDARTGSQRWSKFLGGIPGNASASNGVVYVARNSGVVYAIDARTGHEVWESANYALIYGAPALSDGVVYVAAGASGHGLHALDAATGSETWYFDSSGTEGSSPAVAGGMVYVTSAELTSIYAVDAAAGTEVWHASLGSAGIVSSPSVANGVVYAGSNGALSAFDARDGTLLWTSGTDYVGSPIVANGVAYVAGTWQDGRLYALDATTGELLWSFTSGAMVEDPVVANGILYAPSQDDYLYAFGLGS